MDEHTVTELAYKDGYEAGKRDAMEWIPVTERLPEESGYYLVVTRKQNITVLPYSAKHLAFNVFDAYDKERYSAIECTHWMPLPEPPKED